MFIKNESSRDKDRPSTAPKKEESFASLGDHTVVIAKNQTSMRWFIVAIVIGAMLLIGGGSFGTVGLLQSHQLISTPPWLAIAIEIVGNTPNYWSLWTIAIGSGIIGGFSIAIGIYGLYQINKSKKSSNKDIHQPKETLEPSDNQLNIDLQKTASNGSPVNNKNTQQSESSSKTTAQEDELLNKSVINEPDVDQSDNKSSPERIPQNSGVSNNVSRVEPVINQVLDETVINQALYEEEKDLSSSDEENIHQPKELLDNKALKVPDNQLNTNLQETASNGSPVKNNNAQQNESLSETIVQEDKLPNTCVVNVSDVDQSDKSSSKTTPQKEVVSNNSITKPFDETELRKGLDSWIYEEPSEERRARRACAERIIRCFKTQSTEFTFYYGACSNIPGKDVQISSLPKEIFRLKQLKTLNLNNNNLKTIHSDICQLTNLESLFICYNQLESLPPELASLNQLSKLTLIKNNFKDFPLSICNLTNLKELDLNWNFLTEIPNAIGHLANLQRLNLSSNQIQSVPSGIGQIVNLNRLNLSSNLLTSLPQEIMGLVKLSHLQLEGNRLTAFPSELVHLNNLEHVSIIFNQITSLPNEILEMKNKMGKDITIRLDGNPLSLRVIDSLNERMNADGYRGPIISFSIQDKTKDNRSLEELLEELFKTAEQPPITLSYLCATESSADNLKNWLCRIAGISDYKNTKRKEMAVAIYRAILKADQEKAFEEVFWNCLAEAHSTCGDRMALSILYLDLNFQIAECKDLAKLAYLLGHGTWAMSELEKIAGNKVKTLKFVDEIEVYLAYPIRLKQKLQLPIVLDTMLYFRCSYVTEEDLDFAATIIKGGLSNRNTYVEYLADHPAWQKELEEQYANEYSEIKEKKELAVENATESHQYVAIGSQFKADLVILTNKVLEKVGLPLFLRPS